MSLTNPNKVVTEERLSEFYGEILPYLGGMPELLGNKISRGDLYSTTEKIIGQWIDGKPLYQKTINFGALPNNSSKTVASGLSNVKIINMFGISYNEAAYASPLNVPSVGSFNTSVFLSYRYPTNMVQISAAQDRSSDKAYVTLQYTKNTDSVQAVGVDTDYSTTEKIVGTWIDGKPLYQKTINCGNMNKTATKNVNHGISNLDSVVKLDIIWTQTDNSNDKYYGNAPAETISNQKIYIYADKTSIQFGADSASSPWADTNMNYYATIQYTKTT